MMKKEFIAPCGMNCTICKYHYRKKNTCLGCRDVDENNPITRFHCVVRNCTILRENKWYVCSDTCEKYPCKRLKALDKRYSTKYHMSMIKNLEYIKNHGMTKFLEKETQKWTCPQCGGIVTCHGGICLSCGFEKFKH